jgi:CO/xanthine dehydrogenase Mo-binding subunit
MTARRPAYLDRRDFIKASAVAGGAWLLGVSFVAAGKRRRAHRHPAAAQLNAYVRIAPGGGITLIMPKVEMGQGTFTSLPMLLAEELEVGLDQVSTEHAPPDPKVYGFDDDQSTGGSTSVMQCWLPLRTAGATARAMLISAAAHEWRVEPAACSASGGEVVHPASGRRKGYGALAVAAARLPVPANVPLKDPKDFRLIGRTQPRLDSPAKTDGSARFGIDVRLPRLRYAAIARAPVEGGRVASLDLAAAKAVAGVSQVVNEEEFVAVVGAHTWAALRGLEALSVHWDGGANAAVQQAQLVAELESASMQDGAVANRTGEPEQQLAGASDVHEALFHQPFLAHATMEPMNATAHVHDGLCEIWAGTQAPDRAVAKLALLGFDPEKIRIHNHLIGGGFGRRLEVDGIEYAARVARHVDGPVKVLWRREQDIQHDRYRPYYVDRLRARLDEAGKPLAWSHTIAGSSVSFAWDGQPLKNGVDEDAVECATNLHYEVPNLLVRYVRHEPTGIPTSWWRGVGPTRSVYVIESFIDELAAAARRDPVEYRRTLLKSPRARGVLDRVAAEAGWGGALAAGRGRGISVQSAFGSFLAQVVEVAVDDSGHVRVERVTCAIDCGQVVNPDTVHAQLQGGVIFGLSAALAGEVTVADGRIEQSNFNDYPVLRLAESPPIATHIVASSESPGGVGETGTACIAAALCNAVFAATGKRVRTLPLSRGLKA